MAISSLGATHMRTSSNEQIVKVGGWFAEALKAPSFGLGKENALSEGTVLAPTPELAYFR